MYGIFLLEYLPWLHGSYANSDKDDSEKLVNWGHGSYVLNFPENNPGSRDSLVFLMIARNSSSQAALSFWESGSWLVARYVFLVFVFHSWTSSPRHRKRMAPPKKITWWWSLPIDCRSLWSFKMGSLWDPWMDKWVILKNQFTSCAAATNWSYVVVQASCSFTPTWGSDPHCCLSWCGN